MASANSAPPREINLRRLLHPRHLRGLQATQLRLQLFGVEEDLSAVPRHPEDAPVVAGPDVQRALGEAEVLLEIDQQQVIVDLLKDDEIALVMNTTEGGQHASVLLVADPGMGSTSLLAYACESARRR